MSESKIKLADVLNPPSGDRGTVYFLGIGGIGMSALARFFNEKGVQVSGYDKTVTPLTAQLLSLIHI